MTTPIRVGAVSYLNAKPLYHGLCEFAPDVVLSMDLPSRLAEQLAARRARCRTDPVDRILAGSESGL